MAGTEFRGIQVQILALHFQLCWFPRAAITKEATLRALREQTFIVSQFWRLADEIKVLVAPKGLWENLFQASLLPLGCLLAIFSVTWLTEASLQSPLHGVLSVCVRACLCVQMPPFREATS